MEQVAQDHPEAGRRLLGDADAGDRPVIRVFFKDDLVRVAVSEGSGFGVESLEMFFRPCEPRQGVSE
jgi:hypothetical protein